MRGQGQTIPNDSEFSKQTAFDDPTNDYDIDAPEAWDVVQNSWGDPIPGSRDVVVAIVDSGVDYTHPDLYKNIRINQGEIPNAIRPDPQHPACNDVDRDPARLCDSDFDDLITFADLNHPDNATHVSDSNGNSYIDAEDLLGGWSDEFDDDHNDLLDDLVGWNFVDGNNRPFDDHGHGTGATGIIAAAGDNNIGIAGLNWEASVMPLKFLSQSNSDRFRMH